MIEVKKNNFLFNEEVNTCLNNIIKNKSFVTSKTIGYVMPKNRSIDIDTENDIKKFIESLEKNG